MEMDEDIEIEPMVFGVKDIDLEYEFDATRWYDFTRVEIPAESQAAECWFHSAPSYAPSPFVTTLLLREEVYDDDNEASTKDEELAADVCDKDREIFQQPNHLATDLNKTGIGLPSRIFSSQQGPLPILLSGMTVTNHKQKNRSKFRAKSSIRPTPRISTLMRPTASQLAKQNNSRKFHMQVDRVHYKGFCGTSGTEVQASKRQKLDGGLLRKVADTKQETDFVHKIPKNDTTFNGNSQQARTKITIPQESDFATSHRAHRIRQKNDAKLEQDSTAVYRFKACPLNRKIFDAPSLPIRKKSTPKLPQFHEFHLKTLERAMQHSSSVTTRFHAYEGSEKSTIADLLDGDNKESRRPSVMNVYKHDVSEGNHVFKTRPLNKKILSSRGDMGIFKNNKRDTTVPLEFSFHSEKRVQLDLPTDLFSKIHSLHQIGAPAKGWIPNKISSAKVSKENRMNSFQSENEVTRMGAGKPVSSAGKQIQFSNSRIIPKPNQQPNARWGLAIC